MSNKEKKIAIVIPAYNEATVILETLQSLTCLASSEKYSFTVIVVDDCSSDETLAKVQNEKAFLNAYELIVASHPVNLGQGAALQTGLELAIKNQVDAVVTFDADGQHDPQSIILFIETLFNEKADAVLGSRFLESTDTKHVPFFKQLLLKAAVLFTNATTGLHLTDAHNGFRAFTGEAAKKIHINQNKMAHASELIHIFADNKFVIKEIPVKIIYTEYSMSKGQKMSNSFNILWDLYMSLLRR